MNNSETVQKIKKSCWDNSIIILRVDKLYGIDMTIGFRSGVCGGYFI